MSPTMFPLIQKPKFPLGKLFFTAGVNNRADEDFSFAEFIVKSVQRHANGDWGDLGDHDTAENELSLIKGFRIFSVYKWKEEKIWIITEADRASTTVLFPNEY